MRQPSSLSRAMHRIAQAVIALRKRTTLRNIPRHLVMRASISSSWLSSWKARWNRGSCLQVTTVTTLTTLKDGHVKLDNIDNG